MTYIIKKTPITNMNKFWFDLLRITFGIKSKKLRIVENNKRAYTHPACHQFSGVSYHLKTKSKRNLDKAFKDYDKIQKDNLRSHKSKKKLFLNIKNE